MASRATRSLHCPNSGRGWTNWESLTRWMNCPATGPSDSPAKKKRGEIIAQRLYVAPGSPAEVRLTSALDEALREEEDGVWRIKDSRPLQPCIVSWTPG